MKFIVALFTAFVVITSSSIDKAYSQTSRTISKSCGKCGKSVSSSSKVGDTCPYCGVRWGNENTSTRRTIVQSENTNYDFNPSHSKPISTPSSTSKTTYKFKEVARSAEVKKMLAAFGTIKGLSSQSTTDDIFNNLGEANDVGDVTNSEGKSYQVWTYKIGDFSLLLMVDKSTDKLVVYSIEFSLYSFYSKDELEERIANIKNLYSSFFKNDEIWKYGLWLKGDFQKEFGSPNLESGGIIYYNNGNTQVVFNYDEKNRKCISLEVRINKAHWVKT